VGDGSAWTGGWIGSGVESISSFGRFVSMGWGVLGAAQARMSKAKTHINISFVFIVFSLG
jgi:hypothetical protein